MAHRTDNGAFTIPCSASGRCNHRKHGLTRRDRPATAHRHHGRSVPPMIVASIDSGKRIGRESVTLREEVTQ